MSARLTTVQAEYLRWLAINKILRGRGANPACHRLRQFGYVTIQWLWPREYCYTITATGEARAKELAS